MSDQMSASDGRLPSLDDDEEIGAPTAAVKSRSNVKAAFVVLLVVVIIMLAVGVGIVAMKKRKAAQANAQPDIATQGLKTDPTKVKNTAVEMPSIDAVKAQLKKDEEEASAGQDGANGGAADGYREKALQAAGQSNAPGARPGGSLGQSQAAGQRAAMEAAVPVERVKTRQERMLEDALMAAAPKRLEAPASAQRTQQQQPTANPQNDAISALRTMLAPPAATPGQGMSLAALNREAMAGAAPGEGATKTGIEGQMTPTKVDSRRAGRLGNLDFLLRKNTIIPCALIKGIDTTLPSFPDCKVINDVYSANGRTVLVERGAIINGEQRSRMENGQTRVFVLWTRIDNPSGTYAELDSFGADQMGYGGLKAEVDTHFWARYSGAFLLSLIEDGLGALVSSAQKNGGGNTVQIGNTSSTAQGMANEALKNSINIPPTGRVKPATVISVVVARDIAFESVYKVVQ